MKKNTGLRDAFKAFFDFEEKEDVIEKTEVLKKTSILVAGRIFYAVSDYVIAAGLGAFVFWMEARNFSDLNVYLATAFYDFIAASMYFFMSDMSGCDFTLGQSIRRVANSFFKGGFWGKIIAWILLIGVSIRAIIWEGPEVICFLFRKELGGKVKIWTALFFLSALQGIFGAWLYTTGYALWERIGSESLMKSNYLVLGVVTFIGVVIVVTIMKKMATWIMSLLRALFKKIG